MTNINLLESIMKDARDWAEECMFDDGAVRGGAVANTDSPIEAILMVATVFHFRLWGNAIIAAPKASPLKPEFYEAMSHPHETLLIPQFSINEYRVDFALFNKSEKSVKIAIECDGHQFHERTKDQAQRDKSRDRAIQGHGFKVLRFTGSEIYRKPTDCAREIRDAVFGAIDDAWMARV